MSMSCEVLHKWQEVMGFYKNTKGSPARIIKNPSSFMHQTCGLIALRSKHPETETLLERLISKLLPKKTHPSECILRVDPSSPSHA
ncbi:hypothetical protein QQG55_16540 [Brugia pahangi]